MYSTETPTPIQSRLERIRERRDTPRPLYPIKPTPMAPFVRMAREKRLAPKAFAADCDCGGAA